MKKTALIFLSLLAVTPCEADTLLGKNISVPCTLYVSFTDVPENGVTIPFLVGADANERTSYSVGGWTYYTQPFKDVCTAMENMKAVVDCLDIALSRNYESELFGEMVPVEKADKLTAFSLCVAANEAEISVAFSKKWAKIRNAITLADGQSDDKNVTTRISEIVSQYEEYSKSMNYLSGKISGLKGEIERARAENTSKISELSTQLAELKAMLNTDRSAEALLQIGVVQEKVTSLTMQQAVLSQAVSKIPELENKVSMLMAGGGGVAFALPPQVETYSNQTARLSAYLGSTNTGGTVSFPLAQVTSDADSALTETEGGEKRALYLMRYLWEMGFVPWFPSEAGATSSSLPNTAPDYMEALFGDRYFYESATGNRVSSHAVGVDMPMEWKVASRPWVLDSETMTWQNAHVQFGTQMDAGEGSYSAINGDNYAECDLATRTITIVSSEGSSSGKCYFFIGTVSGGVQTAGTYYTPIILMWE